MINEMLKERDLPDALIFSNGEKAETAGDWLLRREEIKNILQNEEYGTIPPAPKSLKAEILREDKTFCGGKAVFTEILLTGTWENGEFSFPVYSAVPNPRPIMPVPSFVYISFRDLTDDEKRFPAKDICGRGFAVFSFNYQAVSSDDGDFADGFAVLLYKNAERTGNSPGKIAMWARAAMTVTDYIKTLDFIDTVCYY